MTQCNLIKIKILITWNELSNMKKIALISIVSSLAFNSYIYAGGMGDANCSPSAFASVEGGYTWNKIDGFSFVTPTTTFSAVKNQDQYTARLAAGVINMLDDEWGFTGELGWGYYGRTTFTLPVTALFTPVNLTSKYTLTGFDALIGLSFVQTYYTLSLKVGGMIQNMHHENTSITDNVLIVDYDLTEKSNSAAVLPVVKLGAAYNIDANWSITGSYTLTYGANNGTTITYPAVGVPNISVNTQNPMMNTLMLGIQYSA